VHFLLRGSHILSFIAKPLDQSSSLGLTCGAVGEAEVAVDESRVKKEDANLFLDANSAFDIARRGDAVALSPLSSPNKNQRDHNHYRSR